MRNDASHSDILFKTDDATWEAYNQYGGNSLYSGTSSAAVPQNRAAAVSYNRPLLDRSQAYGAGFNSQPFYAEAAMVEWIERNGYDVSYFTDVDTDLRGSEILNHKVFMSVGHDEYWSASERNNITAARDAGVSLIFASGNIGYWKTQYTTSTANADGTTTTDRVLICYKESWANAVIDPSDPPTWTGTWRDPRFSPPADGGNPENSLIGTLWLVDQTPVLYGTALTVPSIDANLRFWRNTDVASLSTGQSLSLGQYVLGYEWDVDVDNGLRPPGLIDMSTTTQSVPDLLYDYGVTTGPGDATHSLTLYRAPSGALVFSAGTVQWSWGLNGGHDGPPTTDDANLQQATVNLLADMGVQPATLQGNLVAATQSTDTLAPTSTITSPPASAISGTPITITGTATDAGGGVVAGVEVSTDGGTTWHPATGRDNWSYTWTPSVTGSVTIRSRAVDDSGNLETPAAGDAVTVSNPSQPLTIFGSDTVPRVVDFGDPTALELGIRFESDIDGYILDIRFYKSAANTGTHIGNLWTSTGTLLATATFTSESSSGWQEVVFSSPVAITAGTTYIASYHTNTGHYSANIGDFSGYSDLSNGPLHAFQDTVATRNGVFAVSGTSVFPSTPSPSSANYWVDIIFAATPDNVPPTITATSPTDGATNVAVSVAPMATFSEPVQSGTIVMTVVDALDNPVPGTISYDDPSHTATFTPSSALDGQTTYTVTVSGAQDLSGNTMSPARWSFTTADVTPPTVSSTSPADGAGNVPVAVTPSVVFSESVQSGTIVMTVVDALDNPVPGTVAYDDPSHTATFTPSSALDGQTTYTVTVSGAQDLSGNTMSPVSWSFTTADVTPPTVTLTSPVDGTTDVPVGVAPSATFSESVQSGTIVMTVVDALDNPVPGTVTYDDPSHSATFTPDAPWRI